MCNQIPKVSILVPVYNVEKYLKQCLDSVVNQTLKDIEIICINDGSKDGSLEILREYESKDSRIKVISKHNSGYGASMNIGLETARGEYIGIVESDDFAEPDMFEKLYNIAKENDLDVARCNFYSYNSKEDTNEKSDLSWVKHNEVYAPIDEWAVFYQQPSIWASIYKHATIEKYKIRFLETPGASYQDTAFAFKTYITADRFMIIDDALLHYRIDNETSSINSPGKVFCVCDEYAEIKRFAKEYGYYDRVKYLIPHIQYNCYKWNFNRLTHDLSWEFMKRWSSEYFKAFREKTIKKKIFGKKSYRYAKYIAYFPLKFLFKEEIKG